MTDTPGAPAPDVPSGGRSRRRTALPAAALTALAVVAAAFAPTVASSLRQDTKGPATTGTASRAAAAAPAAGLPEPVCPPSTYPTKDQQGYAVQVKASITDLTILNGWNEQTRNWQSVATNITAKACGLLKLPSLQVVIKPSGLVFDTRNAIITTLIGDVVLYKPGEVAVKLSPGPKDAVTTVTGVGAPPHGGHDQGPTTIVADVINGPKYPSDFSCRTSPTVTLTTGYSFKQPVGRGPLGPVMKREGKPDLPAWAVQGTPLHDPIVGATATVVANDFPLPIFSDKQPSCALQAALFNPIFSGQDATGHPYYDATTSPPFQPPGASQTMGVLTITEIDPDALHMGPPDTVPTVPAVQGG